MNLSKNILLIGILSLILAACTSPDSAENTPAPDSSESSNPADSLVEEYTFRPVDDIVDQELLVTNFASDGSATLPIETSIPVACTIVYGTTPAFGSLTLDQDMAGGTHSSHNPLLTGLEPDTEYYFRVQGVDDDGIVYLSETMTFTTPPESEDDEETANLASPERGAEILGASSAFGGAGITDRWGAGSAFDGNPNTEWSSAGDGNEAWVEVALESRAQIDSIEFWSRSMGDGSAIALAFTVTTDDGRTLGPFEVPDTTGAYPFPVDIEAETLRFNLIDTTGGNTGAVEIAVYGEFIE